MNRKKEVYSPKENTVLNICLVSVRGEWEQIETQCVQSEEPEGKETQR